MSVLTRRINQLIIAGPEFEKIDVREGTTDHALPLFKLVLSLVGEGHSVAEIHYALDEYSRTENLLITTLEKLGAPKRPLFAADRQYYLWVWLIKSIL